MMRAESEKFKKYILNRERGAVWSFEMKRRCQWLVENSPHRRYDGADLFLRVIPWRARSEPTLFRHVHLNTATRPFAAANAKVEKVSAAIVDGTSSGSNLRDNCQPERNHS